jgi:hypothetical protein
MGRRLSLSNRCTIGDGGGAASADVESVEANYEPSQFENSLRLRLAEQAAAVLPRPSWGRRNWNATA